MKKAQAAKGATVSFRTLGSKDVICFELDGYVTHADHTKFLVEPLRETVKTQGRYRVLMIYKPTFEGWEPEAAQDNMDIVLEFMPFCDRAAYVNPPKKKILQMKITEPLINFDIRYFESGQTDEALAWLKQDAK